MRQLTLLTICVLLAGCATCSCVECGDACQCGDDCQCASIAATQPAAAADPDAPVRLVPDSFRVPAVMTGGGFKLRMLSVADAESDYEAVMASKERLREMYGGSWPTDEFTVEENRGDLARHERQFHDREAFAYTVVKEDESQTLGCVYIYPVKDGSADARVIMWVRDSAYNAGLDPVLFNAVKRWIENDWPFETVIYPGRE